MYFVYDALSCLITYYPVQIMGDLVKPASKDAGGLVQGTVTDLKDKVSTGRLQLTMPCCLSWHKVSHVRRRTCKHHPLLC